MPTGLFFTRRTWRLSPVAVAAGTGPYTATTTFITPIELTDAPAGDDFLTAPNVKQFVVGPYLCNFYFAKVGGSHLRYTLFKGYRCRP